MSMVWGVIHAKLGKQKLNTKISTEDDAVGTSDIFHTTSGYSCSCYIKDI